MYSIYIPIPKNVLYNLIIVRVRVLKIMKFFTVVRYLSFYYTCAHSTIYLYYQHNSVWPSVGCGAPSRAEDVGYFSRILQNSKL